MEKKVNIREMEPKKRVGYIWEYYRFVILGVIVGIIIVVSLIWHFATQKETIANVMMVNVVNSTQVEKNLFSDFMKEKGYDPKKEMIDTNTSLFGNPDTNDATSLYSMQSIQTIMVAGGADVYMSDEKMFDTLNKNAEFKDLTTVLDKSTMEKYKDSVIMATDPDTKKEYISGILLKNNAWVQNKGLYAGDVVIAVAMSSKNDKMSKEIIDYILTSDGK